MKQLEILLNSLIKMWWKPFGMEIHVEYIDKIVVEWSAMHIIFKWDWEYIEGLRTLVSLESWLWQFCMENELLNSPDQYPHKDFRAKNPRPYWEMSLRWDTYYKTEVYQYRLLESALIPEEELGRFLIENIKVEWK